MHLKTSLQTTLVLWTFTSCIPIEQNDFSCFCIFTLTMCHQLELSWILGFGLFELQAGFLMIWIIKTMEINCWAYITNLQKQPLLLALHQVYKET